MVLRQYLTLELNDKYMKFAYTLFIVILASLFIECSYIQAQIISTPQIGLPNIPKIQPNNSIYPQSLNNRFNQKDQQTAIIQEVQAHQRMLQETADKKEQTDRRNEIQRQADVIMLTKYGFPSQSEYEGTTAFYTAFEEISSMLNGTQNQNLRRTVFLVENAWYNNRYDYNEYSNAIKSAIDICNQKIEEEKLDRNNNLVKNMMLFRFISDTLQIRDKATRKIQSHLPVKYNYDDYKSEINFDSHFVTTLMQTGKGQCLSMPMYYLILAEEFGADAYWAFSPHHSFIKIQNEEGIWYNLELTCKAILSDAHYMNSSYIKAEALQNKIYLEPMNKTNVIAEMLLELARGYYQKYGYDDFYLKCIDTAQQYLKNDLNAKMLRSAYQTRLTLTLAHLLNAPNPDAMKKTSPEAYKHYELMQAQYKEIDNMGYEELPVGIYALWLDHIAKEKRKAEIVKQPSILIKERSK